VSVGLWVTDSLSAGVHLEVSMDVPVGGCQKTQLKRSTVDIDGARIVVRNPYTPTAGATPRVLVL
jgi:hypothetical protein